MNLAEENNNCDYAKNPAYTRCPIIVSQCGYHGGATINGVYLPEQFLSELKMATHGFLEQYPPGFLQHLLLHYADCDLIEDEAGDNLTDQLTLTEDEIERRREKNSHFAASMATA